MSKSEHTVRHCPKCGSIRVHRSRRRGIWDHFVASFGGEVCRCHDCRLRQAWFGTFPVRLSDSAWPVGGLSFYATGALGCVLLVWWVIFRYSGLSG